MWGMLHAQKKMLGHAQKVCFNVCRFQCIVCFCSMCLESLLGIAITTFVVSVTLHAPEAPTGFVNARWGQIHRNVWVYHAFPCPRLWTVYACSCPKQFCRISSWMPWQSMAGMKRCGWQLNNGVGDGWRATSIKLNTPTHTHTYNM